MLGYSSLPQCLVLLSAEDQTEDFAHGTKHSTNCVTSPGLALGWVFFTHHRMSKETEAQRMKLHTIMMLQAKEAGTGVWSFVTVFCLVIQNKTDLNPETDSGLTLGK